VDAQPLSDAELLGSLENYAFNDGLGVTLSVNIYDPEENPELAVFVYGDTRMRDALGENYVRRWKLTPVAEA
jgi:hypothetical protein